MAPLMHQTIAALLRSASGQLRASSPTPGLDAELLLAYVLGCSRARLLAERNQPLAPAQVATFASLLERRAALEPVAYLVGQKEFYGLSFEVTPATLIPRPESELLVELTLAVARQLLPGHTMLTLADIGTGSGALAVAVAAHLPAAQIYASDLSPTALAVAERNVRRHGLEQRITLLQGDLLEPLPGPVDLLLSNPPYTILAEVEPGVQAYEPHLALNGGAHDGGALYRRLVPALPTVLRPGGAVLLEIGAWQGALVCDLLRQSLPGATISLHQDLAGHDRVVVARLGHDGGMT